MELDEANETTMMRPEGDQSGEAHMVDQERKTEIRRLCHEERVSISEMARRLDLDRKTVRRCLRRPRRSRDAPPHPTRPAPRTADAAAAEEPGTP